MHSSAIQPPPLLLLNELETRFYCVQLCMRQIRKFLKIVKGTHTKKSVLPTLARFGSSTLLNPNFATLIFSQLETLMT